MYDLTDFTGFNALEALILQEEELKADEDATEQQQVPNLQQEAANDSVMLEARGVRNFEEYTGPFERPLVKLEFSTEKEKEELQRQEEASLREPVRIKSFYSRYQQLPVNNIFGNVCTQAVKTETQSSEHEQRA